MYLIENAEHSGSVSYTKGLNAVKLFASAGKEIVLTVARRVFSNSSIRLAIIDVQGVVQKVKHVDIVPTLE